MLFTTTSLARPAPTGRRCPPARPSTAMSRAARPDWFPVVVVVGADDGLLDRLAPLAPTVRVDRLALPGDLADRPVPAVVLLGRADPFPVALAACRHLRADAAYRDVAVLLFGSRDHPGEETAAFAAGADDFVDRSAPPAVVAARVEALVRRSVGRPPDSSGPLDPLGWDGPGWGGAGPRERPVRVGTIDVDPSAYTARVDGVPVALTVAEFRLLWKFARNVGRVLAPAQLTEGRLGRDGMPSEHAIRSRVFCLRQKLGRAAAQLQTVRGAGYRLVE